MHQALAGEGVVGGAAWPSRRDAAALGLLLLVTALAYSPAVGGDFHWDDDLAVTGNPRVLRPTLLGARDFLPPRLGRDRALTDLTFAANHALSGNANAPFVLTNLAIHLAAAALAWAVARAILRRVGHPRAGPLALLVAALFALHPIQVEAVAFVSQRAESLASALYLAALLAWLRAEEMEGRGGQARWALGGGLLAWAAVAAKGMALTLPVAFLLVLLVTPRSRPAPAWTWGLAWAALAVATVLAISTVRGLEGGGAGVGAGGLGPWRYLLTEGWVVVRYAWLVLWPAGLSVDHAVRVSPGLADPVTLACGSALVVTLGGAAWLATRAARPPARPVEAGVGLGLIWFLVVLAPTSSVIPLEDPMAEHRVYLAALGLFLAVAVAGDALLARLAGPPRAGRVGLALAAVLLAALTGVLVGRTRLWHDDLALWADAAEKAPGHHRPQLHLANALWREGARPEALAAYARAAALVPPLTDAWLAVQRSYGNALAEAGRVGEAVALLEAAVAAAPGQVGLREALAWARYTGGDLLGAEAEVARGRLIAPGSAELAGVAGKAAATRGDLGLALEELERAVALAPASSLRWSDLAIVARAAGQPGRACVALARFVAVEPEAGPRAEGVRLLGEWGCRR